MKYHVIYNPLAGNGTCAEKVEPLMEKYGESAVSHDMTAISDYNGFLSSLEPDDVLIIAGGDGTLNRFVNESEGCNIENEILYFATGTGNDFLRDVDSHDASDPISVKKYIKNLPTVEVAGKSYHFLNGIGYGIDGYCCEVGDKLKETSDKPVNYTSIAIKGLLFHFKPRNARITVDGEEHSFKKVWLVPTMNGRFFGGGMMPTPEQDRLNDDGTVSVMVWHGTGKLRTLMAFPSLFKGEHVKHKKVIEIYKGHEVSVEFDRPTALQIDGETVLGVTGYKVHAGAKVIA